MPELPEIRLMTDHLRPVQGKYVRRIKFFPYSKYHKRGPAGARDVPPPHYSAFRRALPLQIQSIYNIGKRIFITFNGSAYHIIMNMGMTGKLVFADEPVNHKHDVIEFVLDNHPNIIMNDMRKFGTLKFVESVHPFVEEMGYDPLYHKGLTFDKFHNKYIQPKKSRQLLAVKLLDQSIFAGMGNYLRAEVLYESRVDPFCVFDKVPRALWAKIFRAYRKSARRKYQRPRSPFRAYQRTDKPDIQQKRIQQRNLWYAPGRIKFRCN